VTLGNLLDALAQGSLEAQALSARHQVRLVDVRAALVHLARKGLVMPVGGRSWGLATQDLAEAFALADRLRLDLHSPVDGFSGK
jgi:DNA-binding GntR family transcriptional regulator